MKRVGLFKKAVSIALVTAMTAMTVAGCGGKSTSTSSSSDGNKENGNYKDYSKGFEQQVTIKIPVYDRAFEGWDVANNYYTKWIQKEFGDKYNVKVEYTAIGRKTEVADYKQMLAAGTAPDIIFHYDMPQALNYYSDEAMQELDYDEIAYYAPNYYKTVKDTIEQYGKVDGKNAFFFAKRDPIYYNYVTLIRQDWLDKVNMEMPTNLEEFNKVLDAWKEAGLGKNGAQLITGSFTYEYGFLSNDVSKEDKAKYLDLNVAPFTWEPTKEFLKEQNAQFNNGTLDPEFYLNVTDADAKADFVSGNTGVYGLYINSSTDVISSLLANDKNAKVATLNPAALSKDGNAYYYQYPNYGMIMGINAKTSDEQRAAIWMFLDWMSQSDNLFYLQNGVEGQNYNLEDGIAVPVADYAGESKLSNNNNKDYWCLVNELQTYDTEEKTYKANLKTLAPAGYEKLIEDAYKYAQDNEKYGILTPIFSKTVESISEYSADLAAMWKEFYVDLITCKPEEFDAKYEKHCKDYLDGGYQAILDEKESLIKEGAYVAQ
ncbi:MAG: ABC transporter substrate-binding protein [bacterium]|nr:ABC transporter substrate-binding protein [bacterium]